MIERLEGLEYLERLRILNLTTLETRFLRADLIEVYNILKGLDKLGPGRFFDVVDGATRGHSLKLFKRRVRLDVGKYKFGNRVCVEWNGVAEDVVMAGSLVTFKAKLDHHLRNFIGGLFKLRLFPCLLPSWILLDMLDGSTVIYGNSTLLFCPIKWYFIYTGPVHISWTTSRSGLHGLPSNNLAPIQWPMDPIYTVTSGPIERPVPVDVPQAINKYNWYAMLLTFDWGLRPSGTQIISAVDFGAASMGVGVIWGPRIPRGMHRCRSRSSWGICSSTDNCNFRREMATASWKVLISGQSAWLICTSFSLHAATKLRCETKTKRPKPKQRCIVNSLCRVVSDGNQVKRRTRT